MYHATYMSMTQTQTYTATYETGWHATLRAESLAEARRRARLTGRGEAYRLAVVAARALQVWGRDADDDYEEED